MQQYLQGNQPKVAEIPATINPDQIYLVIQEIFMNNNIRLQEKLRYLK